MLTKQKKGVLSHRSLKGIDIYRNVQLTADGTPNGDLSSVDKLVNSEYFIPNCATVYLRNEDDAKKRQEMEDAIYKNGHLEESFLTYYGTGTPLEIRYIASSKSIVKAWQDRNGVVETDDDIQGIPMNDYIAELDENMLPDNRVLFMRFTSFNGSFKYRKDDCPMWFSYVDPEEILEGKKKSINYDRDKLAVLYSIYSNEDAFIIAKNLFEQEGMSFAEDQVIAQDQVKTAMENDFEGYLALEKAQVRTFVSKITKAIDNDILYESKLTPNLSEFILNSNPEEVRFEAVGDTREKKILDLATNRAMKDHTIFTKLKNNIK